MQQTVQVMSEHQRTSSSGSLFRASAAWTNWSASSSSSTTTTQRVGNTTSATTAAAAAAAASGMASSSSSFLPPLAPAPSSAPVAGIAGALRPPGELGRQVSNDGSTNSSPGDGGQPLSSSDGTPTTTTTNIAAPAQQQQQQHTSSLSSSHHQTTTVVHPRTVIARQHYKESIARSQRAQHAAALLYHQQEQKRQQQQQKTSSDNDTDTTKKHPLQSSKKEYSQLVSFCYEGMEVLFAVSTMENSTAHDDNNNNNNNSPTGRPIIYGICARTHLVFQELTLPSKSNTDPSSSYMPPAAAAAAAVRVAAMVASPETGQVVVFLTDGTLQTYVPVCTDPLLTSFGKFRWITNGAPCLLKELFYPTISVAAAYFAPMQTATTTTRSNNNNNNNEQQQQHVDVSVSHNYKVLVAHGDQLAVLDASPSSSLEDEDDGAVPTSLMQESDRSMTTAMNDDIQAEVLWTTRLPGQVVTAKISGNGCAIALVLQQGNTDANADDNDDEILDEAEIDGVHTFERDWDDGSDLLEGSVASSSAMATGSQHTSTSSLPRPDIVARTSSVGILYKPGPFLVHGAPVTKLAFRGLGHRTTQYTARNQHDDDAKSEANDLLLTHCAKDGTARIFEQKRWRPLTEWNTPDSTRVDWVKGTLAFTLGDLESPKMNTGSGKDSDNDDDDLDSNDVLRETLGKRDHLHSIPSHTTPFSSAGAWVSEITFHGPFPAVRLSRLTYLKRGMDETSPTLFESVSAYLPPGSMFRDVLLDMDEPGLSVEGIWPAWNPWLSETVKMDPSTNETLRGSAMSFLGLSSGPVTLTGTGNFGENSLGGTLSPPSEVRFSVTHPVSGRITILDCRLYRDKSQLELETLHCWLLSLSDLHCLSHSAKEANLVSLSASCEHDSSRLVATVGNGKRSIDVVWRRPGTSSLLPSSWIPQDVEKTGEVLANATVFRDESLLPVPVALPTLMLPKSIPENDSIRQILWSREDSYDGPTLLIAATHAGSIVVFEVPPPSSFAQASLPANERFVESLFNDDIESLSSEQRIGRPDYEVAITPDPHHGLGLRLESQVDGSCAIAGSYKRHPLNGEMLPAEKCGMITLGDELLSVNGVSLEQKSFDEIIETVREVSAEGPGKPLYLRFRPVKRLSRKETNSSLDSGRRSMEQMLGVTPECVDGAEAPASDGSRAPFGDLAFDLATLGNANMIVGLIERAIPSAEPSETYGQSRLAIIPSDTLQCSDPGQRIILLTYLQEKDVSIATISIPATGGAKAAKFTIIDSFSPCGKTASLVSLNVFGPSMEGSSFVVQDSQGNVAVGVYSLHQSADTSSPAISHQSFSGFKSSATGTKLVGFSPKLLASMAGDDHSSIIVWTGVPQPGNVPDDDSTNTRNETCDFVSSPIVLEDFESGNRIVDFSFLSSGFLDETPAVVVFSLRGVTIYCKQAATESWLPVIRVIYGGISGSDVLTEKYFDPRYQGIGGMHPFDAFPHLSSSLFSLYHSKDENNFLRSDWHPESLLANICLEKKGAKSALQYQILPTFMWLYEELNAASEDHAEGPLLCSPLASNYINGDFAQQEEPKIDCGHQLRAVQEHLRTLFPDEVSFRQPIAKSSVDNRRDLPFVLRTLTSDDARLLWILARVIADLPNFRSLDVRGQFFLFSVAFVLKAHLPAAEPKRQQEKKSIFTSPGIVVRSSQSLESEHIIPLHIASSGCLSALLCNRQALLLDCCRQSGDKFNWEKARKLRVAFWLRSDSELATLSEEIGQSVFRNGRDIMECALFFIIARKLRTLRNLAATDQSDNGRKFFKFLTSYDFSSSRGRQAAEKNAFSLLRKCKYEAAAAFFLLAEPPYLKAALETIVSKLHDIDLAFLVVRLMTSPSLQKVSPSSGFGTSTAFGAMLGGGGGYAAPVFSTDETPVGDDDWTFAEWKPDISTSAKNLIIDRIMPMAENDTVMTSTLLLWLNKCEEAYWCLSNTVKISFDKQTSVKFLSDPTRAAFASFDGGTSVGGSGFLQNANRFMDFVSGPLLLESLGASDRARFASSLSVSTALSARGVELPALKSLLLYSDIENECEKAEKPSQVSHTAASATKSSSIFDAYDVQQTATAKPPASNQQIPPAPSVQIQMQSSIFNIYDAPKLPVSNPQAPASSACTMESSIFDTFDIPKPSATASKQAAAQTSGEMQSSIFDTYDAPKASIRNPPSESGQMQSSIFDAYDTPQPPVQKQSGGVYASGQMSSSIFDSFDVPTTKINEAHTTGQNAPEPETPSSRQKEEKELELAVSVDPAPTPGLWRVWKTEFIAHVSARRLIREVARILGQFHGDPPESQIQDFYYRDMLVPPGVSSVLQLPCDGNALLESVRHALHMITAYAAVDPDLVVMHAVELLGKTKHRLLFTVVLHSVAGREDLAEKAVRASSKALMERCLTFAFNLDGVQYSRFTRSHASTQFVRREVARLSWQLESCLWIHRGDALPLSRLATKEIVCAVRIGLLIASWNHSYECILRLIQTKPDCPFDDDAGRHLWSSFETAMVENPDIEPKENTGGGWEFLVDCRRSQATDMLRDRSTGCFIIRPHSQDPGVFTLSFKTNLVPTEDQEDEILDRTFDTSGSESELDGSKPPTSSKKTARPVKKSDVVQHAIIRLSESGFRCGSFGPFTSLISLLEAVSASLPFKLRFDKPPTSNVVQEAGFQTSPNAVLLRKLALRHADSITSNPPMMDGHRASFAKDSSIINGHSQSHRAFSSGNKTSFACFLELVILSLLRRQLSGITALNEEEVLISNEQQADEEKEEIVEVLSQDNGSVIECHVTDAYRVLSPFLTWCRAMEVRVVPELAPSLAPAYPLLSTAAVDVTESDDAIEVAATDERGSDKFGHGGDAILRRMIQQKSGVEFTTLRLVDGGEYTMVLLFSKKDALTWLVANGFEQSEEFAEIRLQQLQKERFIEPIDLSRLPLKQKGAAAEDKGIRYRFVDPWEVEALSSREGETKSASLGRCSLLSFSLGKVALASESILRSMGGLTLLELWTGVKGDITLTKALASVHSPWERAAGGDLINSISSSPESSPYLNSIRQHLYRASLFQRLDLPQRFVALIQVELLDLKNLTSPGGSLSLNVYALLRLKRAGSGSPLTNKARTLDSAETHPVKLSKSSGPNAPASWGSVVRFRFPLPEDVLVDATSPDRDREILFRGPPSFLQLSVYEKKLLVDHSLGSADVSMDGLSAGGQLEEWVPLRSEKHAITWFARIRLTLRFELMCRVTSSNFSSERANHARSVGLQRIEELSQAGGAAHEDFLEKRSMSSPDLLTYFESMVY